jgi:hypothetical protein
MIVRIVFSFGFKRRSVMLWLVSRRERRSIERESRSYILGEELDRVFTRQNQLSVDLDELLEAIDHRSLVFSLMSSFQAFPIERATSHHGCYNTHTNLGNKRIPQDPAAVRLPSMIASM